jgi:hypothetical protein
VYERKRPHRYRRKALHVNTGTRVHDLKYMALLGNSSAHDQGKNERIGNQPSISNAYSWDLSIVKRGDATAGEMRKWQLAGVRRGGYEGRGEPQVTALRVV